MHTSLKLHSLINPKPVKNSLINANLQQ